MSILALNVAGLATIVAMKEKVFEIVVGILVAICLGLSGWTMKSLVEHETASAASFAEHRARIDRLEADVVELKQGPTRREWDSLQESIRDMNIKLDRLIAGRGR